MKVNTKLITLLATVAVFFVIGCRTPVSTDPMANQDRAAIYQAGYLYATLDADADQVFRTAIRTMDRMGMLRTGEVHASDYITILGRQVGDKRVSVRVRPISTDKSEVRVRVGIIGNLPESQKIFAKIRDAL